MKENPNMDSDQNEYDPFNAFEEEDRKREEEARAAEIQRETDDTDLISLMSSERGRRIVWRILSLSGVFRSTYNPKAQNAALDMAFNEGTKQTGYWLMSEIQRLTPKEYFLMTEEQQKWQMNKARLAQRK